MSKLVKSGFSTQMLQAFCEENLPDFKGKVSGYAITQTEGFVNIFVEGNKFPAHSTTVVELISFAWHHTLHDTVSRDAGHVAPSETPAPESN
jgi:hypothetical protein